MSDKEEYKTAVCCQSAAETPTALYCRTAVQNDFAIESQKERLLSFANENGYSNPVFYIDNGESGLTLKRPAMKRLISDVRSGKVKRVIVTSVNRIARDTVSMCKWVVMLKGIDVQCIAVDTGKDGFSNEFAFWHQTLRYVYSELFKREKRRDSKRLPQKIST